MLARVIIPVKVNDPVPLIDEDFDAITLDLPIDHPWAAAAHDDEDWQDCPRLADTH